MALQLPSDPKQKKRLLIGIAALALAPLYWYFLHGNYTEEVQRMQTRLTSLETLNATARARAAQGRELEERLTRFERHIVRLEDLVPRGEEVSQLLSQIHQRAEQVGVEVARFTPGTTSAGTHYNRRTFEMTVLGTYHEIGRFLADIGSLPRIITAIDLRLQPNNVRQRENGQLLEASFVIETYVLPDSGRRTQVGGAASGA